MVNGEFGRAMGKDTTKSVRWLKQALDNGLAQAREHLDVDFVAANR